MWMALLAGAAGCAQWKTQPPAPAPNKGLPTASAQPDVVTLETVLVRIPSDAEGELARVWMASDESVLGIAQRRLLARNGLRAGLLIGEIPTLLRDQLQRTGSRQATDAMEGAGLAADVDNRMHRLQCRAGKRKELVVRRSLTAPLTVVGVSPDGSLVGDTFRQPRILFDLRATPMGGRQARIRLIPEIEHGDARQTFVASEVGIRPSLERPRRTWEALEIDAILREDQILMIGATLPPKALGKAFFTTITADKATEHVVLLVRLTATRIDELFAPEQLAQVKSLAER
ncbi:MAG: hypothetical protein D6753_13490 [Planctomycetota bacterium]|nr:MAG: hypothetical protein D6753_13490 [Planctomycetota bacterium]